MPKQITTFEGFIRHILKLVFWVVLLTPLVVLPLYFFVYTLFGRSFVNVFTLTIEPRASSSPS